MFKSFRFSLLLQGMHSVPANFATRMKLHSNPLGLFSGCSDGSREEVTAVIAFGSNMGKRASNIHNALNQLSRIGKVTSTSLLYESSPMYYLEQNSFLNGVCSLQTTHSPEDLLTELKSIERNLGREKTIANGPRPIDLDIIFYGNGTIFESERLQIPHPRVSERAFVLRPLCDILPPGFVHPISKQSISSLCESSLSEMILTHQQKLQRVIPFLRRRRRRRGLLLEEEGSEMEEEECLLRLESGRPILMGILNMTPDSFSDGGVHSLTVSTAVARALQLCEDGAQIIDIGGESTRPGAKAVDVEEEIVPIILMHMRGEPDTMNSMVAEVSEEISSSLRLADDALIPRWNQIVDPGIGFAKGLEENTLLLHPKNIARLKDLLGQRPMLIGLSRKRFLSRLMDENSREMGKEIVSTKTLNELDLATAGACCAALSGKAVDIIRVHNVKD
eukprot:gene23172-30033_t